MSALQLQTAMAKLLTCVEFREQARRDGGASLDAYDLTEVERRELMALLDGRLGLYADCVSAGKEEFLFGNLPSLVRSRVAEEPLRALVRRFIEVHPEITLHPRNSGLAAVLRWMEEELARRPAETPAQVRDVLRFERIRREVSAAPPRYPHPAGTLIPSRLQRHPAWNAERFSYDALAGAPGEGSWLFKHASGDAAIAPCHPLLADLAGAFDQPAEVEVVVAEAAVRHQADDRLGPDVPTAIREVVGELFAEGSLRAG